MISSSVAEATVASTTAMANYAFLLGGIDASLYVKHLDRIPVKGQKFMMVAINDLYAGGKELAGLTDVAINTASTQDYLTLGST